MPTNNPYKFVDPDGRLPILVPVAIFLAKEADAEVASYYTTACRITCLCGAWGQKHSKVALNWWKTGWQNRYYGVFEWVADQGNVTHRRFIPSGTVTGLPNQIPKK